MKSKAKLCILLHFYQPYNQQPDILQRVVNECYLPLTRGLLALPDAHIALNVSGCLTELLDQYGYVEVINNIKELVSRGSVELVGSAKYHAFLPFLPEDEIVRQVALNQDTNARFYGEKCRTNGFFSPEMAINNNVLSVVSSMGYKWAACSENALAPADTITPASRTLYQDTTTGLNLLFRNKRVSSLILSALSHTAEDFSKEIQDINNEDNYLFAVMDAETFGHHRIGYDKMLFDLLKDESFTTVLPSELLSSLTEVKKVTARPSTWSNVEQDFWLDQERTIRTDAKSFILWHDPENPIHTLQWALTDLAINTLKNYPIKSDEKYTAARALLDQSLSSDPYWWASAKPWWSLEMIEQGAFALKTVLGTLDAASQSATEGEKLYRNILDIAFEWQRTGLIRKKHLENSGTYLREPLKKRTPPEWFNQLLIEFESEMNKNAKIRQYEKAIKWRDALIKIQQGTDVYDVLHVVDELWVARNVPVLKPFLEHDWSEFSEFIKQYLMDLEGRPLTQEVFTAWKQSRTTKQ